MSKSYRVRPPGYDKPGLPAVYLQSILYGWQVVVARPHRSSGLSNHSILVTEEHESDAYAFAYDWLREQIEESK